MICKRGRGLKTKRKPWSHLRVLATALGLAVAHWLKRSLVFARDAFAANEVQDSLVWFFLLWLTFALQRTAFIQAKVIAEINAESSSESLG